MSKSKAPADPLGKEEDPGRKEARKFVESQARKGTERVTPAEEVAAVLGQEILRADTQLDEYKIDTFTPQARLIIVLGK